jgi:membrane associated rhomboid family serine protease
MLILGDEGHYHGRFPWVTVSLIVINVVVYVAQVFMGEPFTNGFSLVPEEIVTFQDLQGTKYIKVKVEAEGHFDHKGHYKPRFETRNFPIKHYPGPFPIYLTLFTSMFMHGNLFHLISNMWFLAIFGRNVECAMNHGRFLAFYAACGVFAGLCHVASEPHSIVPCLGASGAIAGVMGAYISIHPLNRIKIWLGWLFGVIEVPALVVIGIWFLLNYVSAVLTMDEESGHGGVAYWSHLGGFVAGFVILRAVVFYLQRQHDAGALEEPEPLASPEPGTQPLPPDEPLPAPVESIQLEPTAIKAGGPDPFAIFLSKQKVPEQKRPEKQPS